MRWEKVECTVYTISVEKYERKTPIGKLGIDGRII
jgi:hypothetical protein